ncbi:MAG: PAS/PAC sensor signal transduction histidine kinase [Stygiobacter sp.]|nr:MAG: PAS/PAC sensor signal transduction histidine kinase [Stygiobacter sp.]KAF0217803.1 MAG: PAS/PAC sensor signal transduction histidine [Ignavibacteria bacterium]
MELSEEFCIEYINAVKNYIDTNGETALNRAYDLGRKSLGGGQSILDTARLHSDITMKILNEPSINSNKESIITSATVFFTEYLSPFVMTFKGFLDVVENLKREINVRKNAEDAFRQSVNYYEALLRNALDIVTILDKAGNMMYYSASVEKILGYTENELKGKNVFSFIHPDDVDRVLELFYKAVEIPGFTATTEFRFRHKNGDWKILESVGKNLLNNPDISGIIVNSRDQTDRRHIEEIRRKYEFIANASKELMCLINRNYQYEAVNEEYCSALSKERSEILGKSISQIFGEDTFNNLIKENIDKCLGGSEIKHETWFTFPLLGKKFMEIAYYPYKNQGDKVTHVAFVKRDVTERKKREDEIKKSQMQLTEAQQIAHIGSWEWTVNSNTIWCSEELCDIFGLNPSAPEISLDEFLNYIFSDDRQRFHDILKNALTNNKPFITEHAILKQKKTKRILHTRGKVVFDDHQLSTKIIGTSQDITQQELAQQAIKSSEIKYRRLFETSKEGLILLDASTGVINDINPFIIEFLGFPKEDFFDKKLWEIKAVKGIPESEQAFREIIEKGYARYDELQLNTNDKKIVTIEFISIAYTVNNDRLIQCHIWDITERKLLLQELNTQAEQRAEDLKNFTYSIQKAHEEERLRISRELHDDVCQRLTGLKFQMNFFEDTLKEKKRINGTKLRSVKKEIDSLIKEVRGISYNLRPPALDHFGLVTALKLLCTESKKIYSGRINFVSDIPIFRHYDPNTEIALYRIGQEALTNCIKHSDAKKIVLMLAENKDEILFSIEDDGMGFDINLHYDRTKPESLHFGLINMRERTEQLGGNFHIESSMGKGTCVEISIPIKKKT